MDEMPRLVLAYLGEHVYHRGLPEDDTRPAGQPMRLRGVPAVQVSAKRRGLRPCPECWPAAAHMAPGASPPRQAAATGVTGTGSSLDTRLTTSIFTQRDTPGASVETSTWSHGLRLNTSATA